MWVVECGQGRSPDETPGLSRLGIPRVDFQPCRNVMLGGNMFGDGYFDFVSFGFDGDGMDIGDYVLRMCLSILFLFLLLFSSWCIYL